MATLQKMKFKNSQDIYSVVCLVDGIHLGGEFTACGCAIPDSSLDIEDFEADGKSFSGSIKEITCINCKKVVNYYKSLK